MHGTSKTGKRVGQFRFHGNISLHYNLITTSLEKNIILFSCFFKARTICGGPFSSTMPMKLFR